MSALPYTIVDEDYFRQVADIDSDVRDWWTVSLGWKGADQASADSVTVYAESEEVARLITQDVLDYGSHFAPGLEIQAIEQQ